MEFIIRKFNRVSIVSIDVALQTISVVLYMSNHSNETAWICLLKDNQDENHGYSHPIFFPIIWIKIFIGAKIKWFACVSVGGGKTG